MKKKLLLIPAFMLVGTLGTAEEASPLALKLRLQTGVKAVDGMRNGFGVGVNYAYKVGPGALNAELGYQYFSGNQYRQPIGANPFGLTDETAVDSRKNSSEGLALRLSWSQELIKDFGFQAGVSLAKLKNHNESIATFGVGGARGAWTLATDKSWFTASPFVGVKWDMNEIGALELNVLFSSYKVTTVDPVYGTTTTTPLIGEKNVNKPKIEFGYTFKF